MNSQVEDRIENNASINSGDKWRAWVNTMPGSSPVLHVVGTVDTARLDIEFDLARSGEEKSNPPNLILTLVERHILVPREPGDTVVEARYSESANVGKYNVIHIEYPDGRITIDHISVAT